MNEMNKPLPIDSPVGRIVLPKPNMMEPQGERMTCPWCPLPFANALVFLRHVRLNHYKRFAGKDWTQF